MEIRNPAARLEIVNADVSKAPGTAPIRMAAVIESATRDPICFYEISPNGKVTHWSVDEVYDHCYTGTLRSVG